MIYQIYLLNKSYLFSQTKTGIKAIKEDIWIMGDLCVDIPCKTKKKNICCIDCKGIEGCKEKCLLIYKMSFEQIKEECTDYLEI